MMLNEQNLLNLFNQVLYSSFVTSILLVFILLIKKILGKRMLPSWHYYIWLLVVLKLIIRGGPASDLSIYNLIPNSLEVISKQEEFGIDKTLSMNADSKAGGQTINTTDDAAAENVVDSEDSGEAKGAGTISIEQKDRTGDTATSVGGSNWFRVASFLWLAGALLLFTVIGIRSITFRHKLKRASCPDNPEIQAVLEGCRRTLKIGRKVELRETPLIESPLLFGIIRPVIILPAKERWIFSTADLRYIFMHELVHLKKRDILIQTAAAVLQIIHWFNPLIWLAFGRMRLDMEIACDDQVLNYINEKERRDYGTLMINLVARSSVRQPFAASAALLGKNMQIRERIKNIADFKQKSRIWAVVGIVLVLLLTGAFMTDARGGAYSQHGNNGQLTAAGEGTSLGLRADPAKVTVIALERNRMVKRVDGREDMTKILQWISGTKCEQELIIDEFVNKEWDGKVLIYEGEEIKDILTLKGNQLRWNSKWYNSNGYLWANLEKFYFGFAYPEAEYQPLVDQSLTYDKTLSLRTPEGRYILNPDQSYPLFDPVEEKIIGLYSKPGDRNQDKSYDIYTIVNVPKEKAVLFRGEKGNKFELLAENLYEKVFNPQKTNLDLSQTTRITVTDYEGKVTLDIRDARIIKTMDQYLKDMTPFTNHDKLNNNLDRGRTITVYEQDGHKAEYAFVENYLYSTRITL